jgi:hypothetical protein
MLDPYPKAARIHLCPVDKISRQSSYGLNELGFVDLTDPGVTLLGTEDDMTTFRGDTLKMIAPGSDINDDKEARPMARHFRRCDLGFMDGHDEPMGLKGFYLNQTPSVISCRIYD